MASASTSNSNAKIQKTINALEVHMKDMTEHEKANAQVEMVRLKGLLPDKYKPDPKPNPKPDYKKPADAWKNFRFSDSGFIHSGPVGPRCNDDAYDTNAEVNSYGERLR